MQNNAVENALPRQQQQLAAAHQYVLLQDKLIEEFNLIRCDQP